MVFRSGSAGNGGNGTALATPPSAIHETGGAAGPLAEIDPGVSMGGVETGTAGVMVADRNVMQGGAPPTAPQAAAAAVAAAAAQSRAGVENQVKNARGTDIIAPENDSALKGIDVSNDEGRVKHELLPMIVGAEVRVGAQLDKAEASMSTESTITPAPAAPPPSTASSPAASVARAPAGGVSIPQAHARPFSHTLPAASVTSTAASPSQNRYAVKTEPVQSSGSGACSQALAAAAAAAASAVVASSTTASAGSVINGNCVVITASTSSSTSIDATAGSAPAVAAAQLTASQPSVPRNHQQPRPPVTPGAPQPPPPPTAAFGMMTFTPPASKGLPLPQGPHLPFAGATIVATAGRNEQQPMVPRSKGMASTPPQPHYPQYPQPQSQLRSQPQPQPRHPCPAAPGAQASISIGGCLGFACPPSASSATPASILQAPVAPPILLTANGRMDGQGVAGAQAVATGRGGAPPRAQLVGANGQQMAIGRGVGAVIAAGGGQAFAGGMAAIGGAGGIAVGAGGGTSGGVPAGPGMRGAPGQVLPPGYVRAIAQGATGAIMMGSHRGGAHYAQDLTTARLGPGVPMNTVGGGLYGGAGTGDGGQIKENTGRWTYDEHRLFLRGLELHGKGWKKIASLIRTRTVVQIRTHAQKYFQKVAKAKQNGGGVGGDHGEAAVDSQGKGARRKSRGAVTAGVTAAEATEVVAVLPPKWYSAGRGVDDLLNQAERLDWIADSGGTEDPATAEPAAAASLGLKVGIPATIPMSAVGCAAADLANYSADGGAAHQPAVAPRIWVSGNNLDAQQQGRVPSDLHQPSLKRVRSSGCAPSGLVNSSAAVASLENSAAPNPAATTTAFTTSMRACVVSVDGQPHQSASLPLVCPLASISVSGTNAPTCIVIDAATSSLSPSLSASAPSETTSGSTQSTALPSIPSPAWRHGSAASSTVTASVARKNDTCPTEVGNSGAAVATVKETRVATEEANHREHDIAPSCGDRPGLTEENVDMTDWIGLPPTVAAVASARGDSAVALTADFGTGGRVATEAVKVGVSCNGDGSGLSPSGLRGSDAEEERLSGLSDFEGLIEDQDLTGTPPLGAVSDESCVAGASGIENNAAAGGNTLIDGGNDADNGAATTMGVSSGDGGGVLDEGMDEDAFVAALLDG